MVAALLLLAIAIVAIPLWLNRPVDNIDDEQRNVPLVRLQLADLKQQLQDGLINQDQYDSYYQELTLTLQADLQPTSSTQPNGSGRWMIAVIAVFLPLLSLMLYLQLGEPEALQKAQIVEQNQQSQANFRAMIPQLIERLKQNPEDMKGWFMLGRTYIYLDDYPRAEQVFAKLYQFQPDNVEVLINYANALAMNNNGQFTGLPEELIEKALKLAPDDENTLWIAGMAKAEAGEVDQAKQLWQKLLQRLPADSSGRAQVEQMLSELDSQMSNNDRASADTANSIQIPVQVSLSDSLKAHAQAEQTVFIYAQAITGPKMPLAIVKKKVSDLPISISLNDSMAMQPGLHLADFKELRLLAKVSQSGTAMTQKGDLLGSVEIALSPELTPVNIIINQEVQ